MDIGSHEGAGTLLTTSRYEGPGIRSVYLETSDVMATWIFLQGLLWAHLPLLRVWRDSDLHIYMLESLTAEFGTINMKPVLLSHLHFTPEWAKLLHWQASFGMEFGQRDTALPLEYKALKAYTGAHTWILPGIWSPVSHLPTYSGMNIITAVSTCMQTTSVVLLTF